MKGDHRFGDEMLRFRRAFARGDATLLAQAITDDFVWHTHTIDPETREPTGRVLRGIDGVLAEIARRTEHWSDVSFDGMVERSTEGADMVVQTFRISGLDRGRRFECDAVDLYRIAADGRVASKDTYWKQLDRDAD